MQARFLPIRRTRLPNKPDPRQAAANCGNNLLPTSRRQAFQSPFGRTQSTLSNVRNELRASIPSLKIPAITSENEAFLARKIPLE
jgi:hypothetical protein